MNLWRFGLTSSLLATLTLAASASPFLDQSQTLSGSPQASFGQTGIAQSFQPSFSNVSGAQVYLLNVGATTLTISLFDNLPNAGGNQLATASTNTAGGQSPTLFWNPVPVVPNQTYYLVLSGSNPAIALGGTGDDYSRGQMFANDFSPFPQYDLGFQTFTNVPELDPACAQLPMAVGFFLLALAQRRRSRRQTSEPC